MMWAAGLMIFWPVVYLAVFLYYLVKAFNFVHSAPWDQFKIANLLVRLHVSAHTSPACESSGHSGPSSSEQPHSWSRHVLCGGHQEQLVRKHSSCWLCLELPDSLA